MLTLMPIPCRSCDLLLAWQAHGELSERARLALDLDAAAVLLRHDVIADGEAEAGALSRRLRAEERLEQPVPDFSRNADAVVAHSDLCRVAQITRRDREGGFEVSFRLRALTLAGRIKPIAEQVQQ